MESVSLFMAFTAGIISFLSPCVLPLVPGYISFVSGVSVEEIGRLREKKVVMVNSIFFIIGFSIIFILLGISATWMGVFFASKKAILTKIAGLIIIFFGIFKMGLIRSFAFYREARFHVRGRKFGLLGALLLGAAFAFGWTPCVGPILGSILAYAGTLGKVDQGVVLLLIYSMGLGIPFLLVAFGLNRFLGVFDRIKKHLHLIEIVSGIILVILGVLVFTDKLILLAGYVPFLNKFTL
jgi:cytochrome c-type biogenesis protein